MTATITTLLEVAQATTKIAEALTTEQLNQVWELRETYSAGNGISVSGFSEVLEDKAGISDYLFASILMDNHYEGFISDNPDFDELNQQDQEAFIAQTKEVLYALNA